MDFCLLTEDSSWWLTVLPVFLGTKPLSDGFVIFYLLVSLALVAITTLVFSSGGVGWKNGRNQRGPVSITGPHGLPVFGSLFSFSRGLAHRTLASMALGQAEKQLMAFSLGSTPVVVSSDPNISKEILTSPHFSNRPIKQSAKMLRFDRAIGFAPDGTYWRLIRKISSTHLFAPKRIAAHEAGRQLDCAVMLSNIAKDQSSYGFVGLRKHLQDAALNNIMGSVFGKRYDVVNDYCQLKELQEMVREGFELLGAFNWSDHIPWLSNFYDPLNMKERCTSLASRVRKLVLVIIKEHENKSPRMLSEKADFVDVLLSLDGEEKLEEDDMIAVLWEMIFRGTDTTALLTEWIMAELILNPTKQSKLRNELDVIVGNKIVKDTDIARLPYLEAVVKETLRVHPPGPLLSWARISTDDVKLSNGMLIPANTTAMINMWAITHDPNVWEEPLVFKPERFVQSDGGVSVDVRGNDLRLAPFGAGRRVCPGKNLGLVTVNLWVAKLVQKFIWVEHHVKPVDLSEVLKLSCEMRIPLSAVAIPRNVAYHV